MRTRRRGSSRTLVVNFLLAAGALDELGHAVRESTAAAVAAAGEPVVATCTRDEVAALLDEAGFGEVELLDAGGLRDRYLRSRPDLPLPATTLIAVATVKLRSRPARHRAMLRVMGVQRFAARVAAGPRGSAVIAVPFDPDRVWGAKAEHPVGGTVNGGRVRGRVAPEGGGWVFTLSPMWMRDAGVAPGDDVLVELAPEGPQRGDLAGDIAAALEADPAAAAFFGTLAQFYRKAYLRYIDATTRRPDLRAARIAEVVDLLAAGIKQRPRP
jgi:hypothetical protein